MNKEKILQNISKLNIGKNAKRVLAFLFKQKTQELTVKTTHQKMAKATGMAYVKVSAAVKELLKNRLVTIISRGPSGTAYRPIPFCVIDIEKPTDSKTTFEDCQCFLIGISVYVDFSEEDRVRFDELLREIEYMAQDLSYSAMSTMMLLQSSFDDYDKRQDRFSSCLAIAHKFLKTRKDLVNF